MKKSFFSSVSVLGLVALSLSVLSQDVHGSMQGTPPRDPSVIQAEIEALSSQPGSRLTSSKLAKLRLELEAVQSAGVSGAVTSSPNMPAQVSPPKVSPPQLGVQSAPSLPKPQKSLADLMKERQAQIANAGPSTSVPSPSLSGGPSSQAIPNPSQKNQDSVQAPVFLPGLGASTSSLSTVPKPAEKSLADAPKRVNNDDHRGINFPEACARVNLTGHQEDASAIDPEHPGDFQVIHGWLEQSPVSVDKRVFATSEHMQRKDAIGKITYQISPDVGEIAKGRVDYNRMEFLLQATIEGHVVLAVLDRVGNFVKCIGSSAKGIVHGKALTPEQIAHNEDIHRQVNEALARGDEAAVQRLFGQMHDIK